MSNKTIQDLINFLTDLPEETRNLSIDYINWNHNDDKFEINVEHPTNRFKVFQIVEDDLSTYYIKEGTDI